MIRLYKYELHTHTAECDPYAGVGGAELVKLYREAGYSGIVITEHYIRSFAKWFADENLASATHEEYIKRWLKGYYAAKEAAEGTDFTVLAGAEVAFDGQINHYLIYGVDEAYFYRAPLLNKCKTIDELTALLPDGALVVQAHPFRKNMTICDPKALFGFEGYNAGTEMFRNEIAKLYARHYGNRLTSGSDVHAHRAVARGGIATAHEIRSPQDLVALLKSGDYYLIEDGEITNEKG